MALSVCAAGCSPREDPGSVADLEEDDLDQIAEDMAASDAGTPTPVDDLSEDDLEDLLDDWMGP